MAWRCVCCGLCSLCALLTAWLCPTTLIRKTKKAQKITAQRLWALEQRGPAAWLCRGRLCAGLTEQLSSHGVSGLWCLAKSGITLLRYQATATKKVLPIWYLLISFEKGVGDSFFKKNKVLHKEISYLFPTSRRGKDTNVVSQLKISLTPPCSSIA